MNDRDRWISAADLIAQLQRLPPETHVHVSGTGLGLAFYDGDCEWENMRGFLMFYGEGSDAQMTQDADWDSLDHFQFSMNHAPLRHG
jgi:hypothetical protein